MIARSLDPIREAILASDLGLESHQFEVAVDKAPDTGRDAIIVAVDLEYEQSLGLLDDVDDAISEALRTRFKGMDSLVLPREPVRKPRSWWSLTEAERAEFIESGSNGCGPKGGKIRPPCSAFFKASCDAHDWAYQQGGTEEDRRDADAAFFGAMVTDAARLARWKRPHFLAWA